MYSIYIGKKYFQAVALIATDWPPKAQQQFADGINCRHHGIPFPSACQVASSTVEVRSLCSTNIKSSCFRGFVSNPKDDSPIHSNRLQVSNRALG